MIIYLSCTGETRRALPGQDGSQTYRGGRRRSECASVERRFRFTTHLKSRRSDFVPIDRQRRSFKRSSKSAALRKSQSRVRAEAICQLANMRLSEGRRREKLVSAISKKVCKHRKNIRAASTSPNAPLCVVISYLRLECSESLRGRG